MIFAATIRVYNEKDKRTFLRLKVNEFATNEEIDAFKEAIFHWSKESLGIEDINMTDVGYIGASNTKFYVRESSHVAEALESRFEHKKFELVLFIEPKGEQKKKKPGKRPLNEDPQAIKNLSHEAELTRVEEIQKKLKDTHGNQFSLPEYFIWAETIENGLHRSYERPPSVPPFMESPMKKKKTSSGDAIFNVAQGFLDAFASNKSSAADKDETKEKSKAEKTADLRSVILGQLKNVGELYKTNILTNDEFKEQKSVLLMELKKLKN